MLSDFIAEHRKELIQRCTAKVAKRPRRAATSLQLQNGVPLFLTQLQRTLEAEQTRRPMESLRISGASGGAASKESEMGVSAAEHGTQLSALGYTVDQVVHDYGDLCHAISEMTVEQNAHCDVDELRTLNRCLDNAIAIAVAAFSAQRDFSQGDQKIEELEPPPALVGLHELRNALATALYAATAMELGDLPMSGPTGAVLKNSLEAMRVRLGESSPSLKTA
jgi:hypothetical protein